MLDRSNQSHAQTKHPISFLFVQNKKPDRAYYIKEVEKKWVDC